MRRFTSCILFLALLPAASVGRAGAETNSARHIQSLLAEHCLECHGPDKQKGGMRVDRRETVLEAIQSGDFLHRITTEDEHERMPPEGARLQPDQIRLVEAWIEAGAPFAGHWAFQPLAAETPPAVSNEAWVRGPIDRFVLARLEALGIPPSPEAERTTYLKRLHYDLTGLPPAPAEVEAYLADTSPDADRTVVRRLLDSPHFGERWGRHWLDMARYADSDGYEKDRPRPHAWYFRDWVIAAVNADLPMDRFAAEQLAGDLLPEASDDQRLATAFHRQTLTNTEGGTDQEEFRVEATFDRTETTGTVWLGLTLNCARCHTHKYDDIPHRDYYRLFAFFNQMEETTLKRPHSEEALARYRLDKVTHDAELTKLDTLLAAAKHGHDEVFLAWRTGAADGPVDPALPEPVRKILALPEATRDAKQNTALLDHFLRNDHEPTRDLLRRRDDLVKKTPVEPVTPVSILAAKGRPTRILEKGSFLEPTEPVDPGGLSLFGEIPARVPGQPDRLDLVRWLFSEANPLTARVLANQAWEKLFGEGLVRTVNDFGVRGDPPTHPELLDWLAREYRRAGWSRKRFIETIVLSATYRQSSTHRPELVEIDPNNHLLARQNRFRVEGEIVRDLCLSVSGLLSPKVGGPSVFPPLPEGIAELSYANNFKWATSTGEDRYRRGLYTFFKRTSPHPNLITFDCPDANTSNVKRAVSNTPLQALTTLNNEVFHEAAQALAARVLAEEVLADDDARMRLALRLCIVREPEGPEINRFLDLLATARSHYATRPEQAATLAGTRFPASVPVSEAAAWTATTRILLNLDEFLTRE